MAASGSTAARRAAPPAAEWRRKLGILLRVVAAIGGGYALAALAATAAALALPMQRADAVLTGMLASFAVYCGAVIWVFAARDALRAWLGILLPAALLAGIAFLAQGWVAP